MDHTNGLSKNHIHILNHKAHPQNWIFVKKKMFNLRLDFKYNQQQLPRQIASNLGR